MDKQTEILKILRDASALKEVVLNTTEVDDSNVNTICKACSLLSIKVKADGADTSLNNLTAIILYGHKTDNRQLKLNALRGIYFELDRIESLFNV